MTIAAFDFDGTLTRKDTLWEFTRYVAGTGKWMMGIVHLIPVLVGFKLGKISNQTAKERVLTHFLGGMDAEELYHLGERFAVEKLPGILRMHALEKLLWHSEEGHRCYIVTASLDIWVKAFADQYHLELVSSLPEIKDGIFTGKIAGKNCRGPEKVRRLTAALGDHVPDLTYAYGDSGGDRELLAWADRGGYL